MMVSNNRGAWRTQGFFLVGIVLLTVTMVACTTTTGNRIRGNYTKVNQLEEADRFFDKGQYQTALLKYSSYLYAPFPDKKYEDYAQYKLGMCQYLLGQYQDAQKTVRSLIATYPQFQYRKQAEELLAKSDQQVATRKQDITDRWNELLEKIGQQQQAIAQNPESAELQFRLGDLYWEAGRFDDAIKQYEKSVKLDSSYLEKKTLRDRVRITDDGTFRLRDPIYENIQKTNDIQVTGVKRDRIVREDWLGQYESIRLSGFVENKGLYDVNNVRVELAIYDFFDTVQETQVVSIGELRAGGRRPFTAMFNQYRGFGIDITKYTTEVYYDEPAAAKR